jgi:Putative Actinobacterial Holin-X, holin superfamily III
METKSENWIESAGGIIETYRDLVSIKIVEKTSRGISVSIYGVILLVFIIFILLFLGTGAAWWIGESLNNMKAGFFIVSGTYVVLFTVLMLIGKKYLIPGIRNIIIRMIYDED